jgi:hypothetical protein
MTGFTKSGQVALLDSTAGLGKSGVNTRTLYLALFKYSSGATHAGLEPNDDGSLPSGLVEVTGAGYARLAVDQTKWDNAIAAALGTPSSKSSNATLAFTASGGNYGELLSWGLYDASTAGTLVCSGPLTNSAGSAIAVTVNDGETFQFDSANPIRVQLGDLSDTFA